MVSCIKTGLKLEECPLSSFLADQAAPLGSALDKSQSGLALPATPGLPVLNETEIEEAKMERIAIIQRVASNCVRCTIHDQIISLYTKRD